jgi:hypothetical protein
LTEQSHEDHDEQNMAWMVTWINGWEGERKSGREGDAIQLGHLVFL